MTPALNPKADYLRDKQQKEEKKDSLVEAYNTKLRADSDMVQKLLSKADKFNERVEEATSNNYQVA